MHRPEISRLSRRVDTVLSIVSTSGNQHPFEIIVVDDGSQDKTVASIQDWKNRGGWNDDWALSTAMIRAAGVEADYDAVVKHFQAIFHGNGADGLIMRERWIASAGFFAAAISPRNTPTPNASSVVRSGCHCTPR